MAAKNQVEYPYADVLKVYRYLSTIDAVGRTALRAEDRTKLKARAKTIIPVLKRMLENLEDWRAANAKTEYPVPPKGPVLPRKKTASKRAALKKGSPKESELALPPKGGPCGGRCREPTPFCCNDMCVAEPCL